MVITTDKNVNATLNSQTAGTAKTAQPQDGTLAKLTAIYTAWAAKLTPDEKAAFAAYRTPGVYYILNYFLRHGTLPAQQHWQHFDADSLRNLASLLNSAIQKAEPLKEPLVVLRSMVLPDRIRARGNQVRGQWLEERGFCSTTADMGVLKTFEQKRLTKPEKGHEPVCLKITIPAGAKVAYIEPALGGFSEHEVLFPLGTPCGHSMQFMSDIENIDGLPTVSARYVPNGARANWNPPFPSGWKPTGFNLDDHFER